MNRIHKKRKRSLVEATTLDLDSLWHRTNKNKDREDDDGDGDDGDGDDGDGDDEINEGVESKRNAFNTASWIRKRQLVRGVFRVVREDTKERQKETNAERE